MRCYTWLDNLLHEVEQSLKTVSGESAAKQISPAASYAEGTLSPSEKRKAGALLRVDHAGEVCAQALYRGHALVAHTPAVREAMLRAADEEQDHLAWCTTRLHELNTHASYLNPFWYWGSFAMGACAGWIGDGWNLGFVVETERQVEAHLADHLQRLPAEDVKSRAILQQMQEDEVKHAEEAQQQGAKTLPLPLRSVMRLFSKVMTSVAYYV